MGKERGNKDSALGRKNDLRIINILGSVERVEAEMGYCMKENAKIKTLIVDDEKISRGFFEYSALLFIMTLLTKGVGV